MNPEELSELSRLLDEVLPLDEPAREARLAELACANPRAAEHLRSMLARADLSDTELLPRLPEAGEDGGEARAGERVGPYALVREIGRGGMGSVWLAERADGVFKRRVALKLPRLAWVPGLARRMAREREIGALLEHPNIARLYDAGVDEHGRPFIAMEYIEGRPIDVDCRERGLDVRARLTLFLQVVQAVAYAHRRLVLHRDLKPGNVLVSPDGQAHLLDFGIAKLLDAAAEGTQLTQEQGRMLTLNYASPEQVAGRPLSVATDVYALGVMLYELLTGTLPYRPMRDSAAAMEEAILAGDAAPPSSRVDDARLRRQLRGDLDAIVGKAIKHAPNDRYPSAEALAADIQRILSGRTVEARPDSVWYRLRKAIVRHRMPVFAAAAVLVVALAGGAATLIQSRRALDEAERARIATAFVSELFRLNAADDSARDRTRLTPQARIERGAQLIEARFEKQPAMKAEMYGTVARIYADLGVDRLASEYASRQLQTLRNQRADRERIGKAHLLMAESALAAHRNKDAEDLAQEALRSLPANSASRADALALLARAQLLNGRIGDARRSLIDARLRLDSAHDAGASSAAAWLLFVEAELLRLEGRFDESRPLRDKAIASALRAEGPLSRAAIELRLHYAALLIGGNKPEEAFPLQEAAEAALKSLGGVYAQRAVLEAARLQSTLAAAWITTNSEAVAALEKLRPSIDSQEPPLPSEVRAEIDSYYGEALMHSGDIAVGVPLVLRSADELLAVTQDLQREFNTLWAVGWAFFYVGDHAMADKVFRRLLGVVDEWGRSRIAGAATLWDAVSWNMVRQGRPDEAEAFLSAAPRFVIDSSGTQWQTWILYATARARLARGDSAGAWSALPEAELPLEESDPFARQIRGEVLCARGNHAAGLRLMHLATAEWRRLSGPNHPEVARQRSVAGLCALASGDRKQAEELAELARAAFKAQPGVSPSFKKPLAELEKRLGANPPSRQGATSPASSERS